MEALSPRSPNQIIKPKKDMERKVLDKNAVAANDAQRAATTKNHAPPPPSLVIEPDENGERYSTGPFLGRGGFAVCYEGKLLRNGRVFAMKVVKSEMTQKKMEEKVFPLPVCSPERQQFQLMHDIVSYRAPNPLENATSTHRPILPSLCFR